MITGTIARVGVYGHWSIDASAYDVVKAPRLTR